MTRFKLEAIYLSVCKATLILWLSHRWLMRSEWCSCNESESKNERGSLLHDSSVEKIDLLVDPLLRVCAWVIVDVANHFLALFKAEHLSKGGCWPWLSLDASEFLTNRCPDQISSLRLRRNIELCDAVIWVSNGTDRVQTVRGGCDLAELALAHIVGLNSVLLCIE